MWDLNRDLDSIRSEFPILARSVYLISNSLGAVPRQAMDELKKYYLLWAEEGVGAWEKEWWNLSRRVGNQVASLIGAGEDEVTMMTNATVSHWVALSTRFMSKRGKRNKIILTDHDFPSILYAVSKIAQCMGWELEV
ncbi:MAG: aminotransferase class V-fold PLP-dependent enzyme, partial [Acidobacteriota bacterium]